jgi:hypothetical protein
MLRSQGVDMSQDLLQDWQTLYSAAISEAESGTEIEKAEVAIQRRLEDKAQTLSALEEAKLYAALRSLKRLKVQFLSDESNGPI